MAIRSDDFTGAIADRQRAHIALAEKMIRKYWSSFFYQLDGDEAVINFAKSRAALIDKLDAIARFHGGDYAKFCISEGHAENVFAEQKTLFEVFEKADVLSYESRKEALLGIDDRVIDLINYLPKASLNKYLLIVHNEGTEKAEEVRKGDLENYDSEYLRVYQPDISETPKPQSFSQKFFGALGRAQ